MKLGLLTRVLLLTFLLSALIPAWSAPTITPGALCKKVGSTQTYKGKIYACKKVGKKLIWNKGVELGVILYNQADLLGRKGTQMIFPDIRFFQFNAQEG
jgi:hypothetical protein